MPGERTPFEERIAAALHARAADVRTDPATWQEVEARISRDRRFRFGAVGFAIAAVAAFAVIAVPTLVRRATDVEFQPGPAALSTAPATLELPVLPPTSPVPATPAPSEGATDAAGEDGLVVTDGTDIVITDGTGATLAGIISDETSAAAVPGFAVRPGSTPDAATVAFQDFGGASCSTISWVSVAGNTVRPAVQLEVSDGNCAGKPVFSPDGQWLAWLERLPTLSCCDALLHAVRWSDDRPVEGSDVTFGVPITQTNSFELIHWTWDEVREVSRRGALKFLVDDGTRVEVYTMPIEVQDDGALAVPGDPVPLAQHSGAYVVARTDTADVRVRYAEDATPLEADLIRRDAPDSAPLRLPQSLLDSGITQLWLTAASDFVLVGSTSGEAYRVRWNAAAASWDEPGRLAGTVRFAAPLPAG